MRCMWVLALVAVLAAGRTVPKTFLELEVVSSVFATDDAPVLAGGSSHAHLSVEKYDPARQQFNIPAVSTTLRCTIWLTVQFLLVLTSLAIARNVDELNGVEKPNPLTCALSIAGRTA